MGAEERQRIVRDSCGEVVQARFEGSDGAYRPRRQGGPRGHQALTGMGASRRQRTAADLAGHDRGPPIAVSAVLLGRPPPGVGPVLEAGGGRTAPLLEVAAA